MILNASCIFLYVLYLSVSTRLITIDSTLLTNLIDASIFSDLAKIVFFVYIFQMYLLIHFGYEVKSIDVKRNDLDEITGTTLSK